MESIENFLRDCLKSVDLKTVTKAELKKMYIKNQNIEKLSKEQRKLFSSAVEKVYIDFVRCESDDLEKEPMDNIKANSCESGNISSDNTSDQSHDSGLGTNTLDDNEALSSINSPETLNHEDVIDSSITSLEKESVLIKNEKENYIATLTSNKEVRDDKSVIEENEDTSVMSSVGTESNKIKSNISDSEDEPLVSFKRSVRKSDSLNSDDSEDEPLVPFKRSVKKSASLNSDQSELANIKKHLEKEISNEVYLDSKDTKKLKGKLSNSKQRSVLSDSEEEDLVPAKKTKQLTKRSKKISSSASKSTKQNKTPQYKKVQKSFYDSSDLEEKPLISKAQTSEDSTLKKAKAKQNKSNAKVSSDSNKEFKKVKKSKSISKRTSQISSDDSDDEPLINLKEIKNNNNKSLKSSPKSKRLSSTISSDDSDDDPLINLKEKKNNNDKSLKSSPKSKRLPSTISSEDSDDDPLINLKGKKNNNDKSLKSSPKSKRLPSTISCEDSDDDPLINLKGEKNDSMMRNECNDSNKKNPATKKIISHPHSNDSDSDEGVATFSKNNTSVQSSANISNKKSSFKKKSFKNEEENTSGNEISQEIAHNINTSDSEEELLPTFFKEDAKPKNSVKRKKIESSSDESENEAPILKKSKSIVKKSAGIASDSEDEPLASLSEKISKKNNVDKSEDSSVDENEERPIIKSKEKGTKAKEQKKLTSSEIKLENLKKYVRTAGIHIKSYDKLFENSKSMKSKCEKLMHLLEKEGLKGRPTLAKCKKLKKKIETKKEVAELDLSNIISSGRLKRKACSDTTNQINDDDGDSDIPLAKYSRLKGIVDSEGSD